MYTLSPPTVSRPRLLRILSGRRSTAEAYVTTSGALLGTVLIAAAIDGALLIRMALRTDGTRRLARTASPPPGVPLSPDGPRCETLDGPGVGAGIDYVVDMADADRPRPLDS